MSHLKGDHMYIVYHGWIDGEPVAEFKTMKQAVKYIESQKRPDEYCFEKERKQE